MESSSANQASWTTLFQNCFRRRIRATQLSNPFSELWSTQPIAGSQLASIIFTSGAPGIDPLINEYLEQILRVTSIDTSDILIALLAHSRYALRKADSTRAVISDAFFEYVLSMLVRLVASGERPKSAREVRNVVRALGECLTACRAHEMVLMMQNGGVMQTPDQQVVASFETLATLAIALLNHHRVKTDIELWPQSLRERLSSSCSEFAELISGMSHSQIGTRLHMLASTLR